MTSDDLLNSLILICNELRKTPSERKRCIKKFKKAYREGTLHIDWNWGNALWCYNLCVAELIQGRYHWKAWETRSGANMMLSIKDVVFPRWDGNPCKLLVIAEQGIGDEILFASCFPDLIKQCPDTTFEADPRLIPIFQRSFEAEFISRWDDNGERKSINTYPKGAYDAFVPAGDLPKIYRRSRDSFPGTPYLKHKKNYLKDFPNKTYGISWYGRQGKLEPQDLKVFPGNWVDLQYGPHKTPPGIIPTDWNEITQNIDLVFDLVASMDAVVCIPNTLAHIAGAVGTRAHVIRPPAIYPGDDLEDINFHNRLNPTFGLFNGSIPWYNCVTTYSSIHEFKGRYSFK